ncbi:hypothetical protein D3C73_425900 [compost metagenome]
MLGNRFHLDRVAQVRLVGTVFADRDVIRDAREFLGDRFAFGKLFEDAAHDRFHRFPDFFLGDEAHFEVELVEFARQAVSTRVFVAEARCNLEVAVETGNHHQLLVLLRRLRQGEELAGVDTRRHEEVACAFRRGCGQDRRGIFGEATDRHFAAHGGDDLGALDDVFVQRFAAKVEEAILQAHVFRIFRLTEDRQRQFLGSRQNLDFLGVEFDLARRHVLVDGVFRTSLDGAVDTDDPLAAHDFSRLEGRAVRVADDLGHAIMVAKVDEENAAMISHTMDPAGNADIGADIRLAEGCTGVAAVTMHVFYPGLMLERPFTACEAARSKSWKIGAKSAWVGRFVKVAMLRQGRLAHDSGHLPASLPPRGCVLMSLRHLFNIEAGNAIIDPWSSLPASC